MTLETITPVRLELAGGSTDIAPYDINYGGAVLNATLDYYVKVKLIRKKNQKLVILHQNQYKQKRRLKRNNLLYNVVLKVFNFFSLKTEGELTICQSFEFTGLGGSASLLVSLIKLCTKLNNQDYEKEKIAELAYRMETHLLDNICGRQDQYAAAFGGLNLMYFHGGANVDVKPLVLRPSYLKTLEKNLLLYCIGKRNKMTSGQILTKQLKSYSNSEVISNLHRLKTIAIEMKDALVDGDFNIFARLLTDEWETKKMMNPTITIQRIENLIQKGLNHGALGARLVGAGKGGYLLFYVPKREQKKINFIFRNYLYLPVKFSFK